MSESDPPILKNPVTLFTARQDIINRVKEIFAMVFARARREGHTIRKGALASFMYHGLSHYFAENLQEFGFVLDDSTNQHRVVGTLDGVSIRIVFYRGDLNKQAGRRSFRAAARHGDYIRDLAQENRELLRDALNPVDAESDRSSKKYVNFFGLWEYDRKGLRFYLIVGTELDNSGYNLGSWDDLLLVEELNSGQLPLVTDITPNLPSVKAREDLKEPLEKAAGNNAPRPYSSDRNSEITGNYGKQARFPEITEKGEDSDENFDDRDDAAPNTAIKVS